ncbi:hypothetical protein [Georgenia sp. SYP-B2076]|uniref:hypothetical protein n=1 Tax=Georgenia sp. SYP-B2076 TaxID=2495881 RepID=UPI000F8CFD47|nr:hypothetical protein [Georgenia sp. SYP-B2076]
MIGGVEAGADVTWSTKDGDTALEIGRLPSGVSRGAALMVDGGLAAPGHLRTAEHDGPVLWLSSDGKRWRWVPVPSNGGDDLLSVHTAGDDLLVVFSGATAEQAWLVKDVATVLTSTAPEN